MDGLYWKTLLKWGDLGVPLFSETSIKYYMNCDFEGETICTLKGQYEGKSSMDNFGTP